MCIRGGEYLEGVKECGTVRNETAAWRRARRGGGGRRGERKEEGGGEEGREEERKEEEEEEEREETKVRALPTTAGVASLVKRIKANPHGSLTAKLEPWYARHVETVLGGLVRAKEEEDEEEEEEEVGGEEVAVIFRCFGKSHLPERHTAGPLRGAPKGKKTAEKASWGITSSVPSLGCRSGRWNEKFGCRL
ncbi:hypothetical protein KM043_003585 [Ampulex compressa]|nr:hypothetical protein KM043_003585 [Ampulex compressa]